MASDKMTLRVTPRMRDIHQWHSEHIRQGLREAKAGKFASRAQVKKVVAHLRKK